jgi:hypothetical protein
VPKTITIEPITSKGNVGRCAIEIPAEDLPQVIKELFCRMPSQIDQLRVATTLSMIAHRTK